MGVVKREEALNFAKNNSVTTTQDFSVLVAKAEGPFLWDVNGKRYLDFHSSFGTANFGHNNAKILSRIQKFISKYGVFHSGVNEYPNKWAIELMDKLINIVPLRFDKKVFLCNSGTEAVECALKIMIDYNLRNHPEKNIYLGFEGGFHGRTLGSLIFNASKEIHHRGFPKFEGIEVVHLPFPEVNSDADPTGVLFSNISVRKVGGIIFEIVQGEGGINVADWLKLRKFLTFLKRYGVIVAIDEVQTGMCRTEEIFACKEYGLNPDIICLGKSLGGGLPIGATVIKKELDFKEIGRHSNTFGGNPLVCAAASAVIDVATEIDKKVLQNNIKILRSFASEGLGMMRRKRFATVQARDDYVERAKEKGILLAATGEKNVRFMPPVNIDADILTKALRILEQHCN